MTQNEPKFSQEAQLTDILAEIDLRFASGNEIVVERASVRATEWAAIRQFISATLTERPADETCAPLTQIEEIPFKVVQKRALDEMVKVTEDAGAYDLPAENASVIKAQSKSQERRFAAQGVPHHVVTCNVNHMVPLYGPGCSCPKPGDPL